MVKNLGPEGQALISPQRGGVFFLPSNGMASLVEQMLDLNKKRAESKIPQTAEMLRRQIESTDKKINDLVYKLYDLTDEEIKIVESEV